MAKKAALGRGLDALLSTSKEQIDVSKSGESHRALYDFDSRARSQSQISEIDIASIAANPYQPRTNFNRDALDELAASIKQLGIIQPLTVRAKDDGSYELISGERRLRASKLAGLKKVPAYVRKADVEAMLEMAIVENIQRENLDPVEIALGYQRLIDECGLTQGQVADKVGKNRSTVTNLIRLLKLPPEIQSLLRNGTISVGHARALLSIDEVKEQIALANRIESEDLTVRDVEKIARSEPGIPPQPEGKSETPEFELATRDSLELKSYIDSFRKRLGTNVQIKRDGTDGGRIEISFYSDDDLDRIAELLLD